MDTSKIISLGKSSGRRETKRLTRMWGASAVANRSVSSFIDSAIADLALVPGYFGLGHAESRECIALHILAARSVAS